MFHVVMLNQLSADGYRVQSWIRDLIHRTLGLELAAARKAFETMFCVIVLGSHQPQGCGHNAGLNDDLISGILCLKLAVALGALEAAVFRIIMLSDRQ